ncbi:Sec39 domain-containing protein [Apodospora peruviana]|uniref:Sec39 domain-containing protein n=1 Tax=Apodospora peruviana TaxID=516989 RepID=A0AAE0MC39_9PEZI|nr:Sec39 domain-containing protein [Apodospora peruviana]
MSLLLSPPKLVLLAVHLAVKADIVSLTALAARHGAILRKELLLRIILTYLPETLRSAKYVAFVQQVDSGAFPDPGTNEIDCSAVEGLTEDDARTKVKKLRLLPLNVPEAPGGGAEDATTLFLLRRAYRVDEEAGLLDELPGLLSPFLDHSPCIRTLMVSSILPLLRRNCEYHPHHPISYTLHAFQQLPDNVAASLLLSQTGAREEDLPFVGRELKGLIGPWLMNERRWKGRKLSPASSEQATLSETEDASCPGWEYVLRWLTGQASKSWRIVVNAVEQWDGPKDIDLGGWGDMWLNNSEQDYLVQTYAQAALASAYLIPEASIEALEGAYSIVTRTANLLGQDPISPLHTAAAMLPPLAAQNDGAVASPRNATYMRNDLLDLVNPLTSPTATSTSFLQAIILSAFILTRSGCPCSLRKAGELALLQDEREQKAEATKLIHALTNHGPKTDDRFWIKARNEILWLRDWVAEDDSTASDSLSKGVFGQLKREFLEVEMLKAFLANTRYTLARSIYEDSPDQPLAKKVLQDTILATAMTAYDNASNANRTRGGLKKCDDIIKAFPKTIDVSMRARQRLEALLQATHALSEYRLVLKQGEPFTPVVLRIHTDPISIIGKILEQNPKSYTRVHDLLDLGALMVKAGLTAKEKTTVGGGHAVTHSGDEAEAEQLFIAKRRVTALCIDAALTEDDFETAYSYVLNRLSAIKQPEQSGIVDEYSWKAALQAGKYRRTARTVQPTHIGTASANFEIRHLEQRIECLSTALRIAPSPTLQEILNAFRRAEEELDAAIKAEAEQEDAWDSAGDSIHQVSMPGTFNNSSSTLVTPPTSATKPSQQSSRRQQQRTEEAPMSLFDLTRTSVLSAQKNLSALSGLQRSISFTAPSHQNQQGRNSLDHQSVVSSDAEDHGGQQPKRTRKRDQLREAAMGSLVSGVGWLINAPAAPGDK